MGFQTKTINQSEHSKLLFQNTWLVEKTVEFSELRVSKNARIIAPEGKMVTLIVNGVAVEKRPGTYLGKVVLAVSERYNTRSMGMMKMNSVDVTLAPTICIEGGELQREKGIPELIQGGSVTATQADGIYIAVDAEEVNGIVVDNSKYMVANSRFDFEGFGANDFMGAGAAVAAYGNSEVAIDSCEFNMSGITRCAVHAAEHSVVTVTNSDIVNFSPATDLLGSFLWQIPLKGSNRLCQQVDNTRVVYDNCRLKTNGWGITSIDAGDRFVSLTIKDSEMKLVGPRGYGYGTFCIGPNEVIVDHSVMDVYGFPMLVMGMQGKGRPSIINNSLLKGRRFGAMLLSDDRSIFTIKDSTIDTVDACIVAKASTTTVDIDNSKLLSEKGILLCVMDTEESGMTLSKFFIPVGEKDVPIEGRDLSSIAEGDDFILNLSNMSASGDIFNTTTNIRAYQRSEHAGMGDYHDMIAGLIASGEGGAVPTFLSNEDGEISTDAPPEMPPEMRNPDELRGPKNLAVNLRNASLSGTVSSATQSYREGLREITAEDWFELSNVSQEAAPAVNNGVVVSLNTASSWTVTGTSYLTKLELADGARLLAPDGKELTMTVDGAPAEIAPGSYSGSIVLSIQ